MDNSKISSSLRSAISLLHKRLRKQMYSTESYSITEITTLGRLYRQDQLLPSELATMAKVKTQSMSQILKKMENQNVIVRIPCETDKRKTYISLTDSGRKLVEQTQYERDEWLTNAIRKNLSRDERRILMKSIEIMHKLAESE